MFLNSCCTFQNFPKLLCFTVFDTMFVFVLVIEVHSVFARNVIIVRSIIWARKQDWMQSKQIITILKDDTHLISRMIRYITAAAGTITKTARKSNIYPLSIFTSKLVFFYFTLYMGLNNIFSWQCSLPD